LGTFREIEVQAQTDAYTITPTSEIDIGDIIGSCDCYISIKLTPL